jgi:hypothetical protein
MGSYRSYNRRHSPDASHSDPPVRDKSGAPDFEVLLGGHLIAYATDDNPACVVTVMHGRRYPRVMAAILRGRRNGLNNPAIDRHKATDQCSANHPNTRRRNSSGSALEARV